MIVDILELKHRFTLDEKIEILKAALQTQEGVDEILRQCGPDFKKYLDQYGKGDNTELGILTVFMGLAAFEQKRGLHVDSSGIEESDED